MNRRSLLLGLGGILTAAAAPAIVRAGVLMPVRRTIELPDPLFGNVRLIMSAPGPASRLKMDENRVTHPVLRHPGSPVVEIEVCMGDGTTRKMLFRESSAAAMDRFRAHVESLVIFS